MKLKISSFLVFSFLAQAGLSDDRNKVIYGTDNRKDLYQSTNATHKHLAKSTAAMIHQKLIQPVEGTDLIEIKDESLHEALNICSTENFSTQITSGNCSGFLISDVHLVTAGHCMLKESDCSNFKWAFDYAHDTEPLTTDNTFSLDKSKIYSCKKVIERSHGSGKKDFAVIELDRAVLDRDPAKFRTSGSIAKGTPLVVIGHPSGLPTKIADGAEVYSTSKIDFMANLDTFSGNSGSAVFNDLTGEIEGILVSGAPDYVLDSKRGCKVSNKCSGIRGSKMCKGESITKITDIKSMNPSLRPPTGVRIAAFLTTEPDIIADFVGRKYKDCHVRNHSQKQEQHQLYIGGQFKGNFIKSYDDQKLKYSLASYVLDGTCTKIEPSAEGPDLLVPEVTAELPVVLTPEISPESDEALIEDFISRKYVNCFIRPRVREIYNQLFINGTFKGNHVKISGDRALAVILRKYISDNICRPRTTGPVL